MTTVAEHYAGHLAPIHVWMAGGVENAMARAESEIAAWGVGAGNGRVAVDLGAGFGAHAIPLARQGFSVVAIDSSALLLDQLHAAAMSLPVRVVCDDLLAFASHVDTGAPLIVCLGDSLTHLADEGTVGRLFARVADVLLPGGCFVATFRDYTTPLADERRFIPVRSDADRILTCFLEYEPGHVRVHDILHERHGQEWTMRVSSYRKLRLAPEWVVRALEQVGLRVRIEAGMAGMVRVIGTR